MAEWTIYYNERCASCKKALDTLNANGIRPRIVEYLKNPPTVQELDDMLRKLGMVPEFIVRTNEPIYEQLKLNQGTRSRAEWLKIISAHPELLQRPIVIKDNRGIIARPSEKISILLGSQPAA